MATKDFSGSQNQDNEARNSSTAKTDEVKPPSTNQDNLEPVEIKNAHATGDGSFGRSESSLPDEEAEKKQGNSNY